MKQIIMLAKIPENKLAQINKDIAAIYENVATELSQLSAPCTACGFCCHFEAAEHFLYASTLEMLYIFDKYQAGPIAADSDVCPFLKNKMCSIRDRRMLGCRTYFRLHSEEERVQAEAIYERSLLLLKKLHEKYQIDWHYQDCMAVFRKQFGLC